MQLKQFKVFKFFSNEYANDSLCAHHLHADTHTQCANVPLINVNFYSLIHSEMMRSKVSWTPEKWIDALNDIFWCMAMVSSTFIHLHTIYCICNDQLIEQRTFNFTVSFFQHDSHWSTEPCICVRGKTFVSLGLFCIFFFHRLFVDIFILESNQSFIHLILRMTVHKPGAEKLRLVYA